MPPSAPGRPPRQNPAAGGHLWPGHPRNIMRTLPLLLATFVPVLPAPPQEPAVEAPHEAASPAKPKVVHLRPSGAYADLAEMALNPLTMLVGGSLKPKPFYPFLDTVRKAAGRSGDQPLLLDLSGKPSFNPAQLRELERTLAGVRAGGTRVVAYVENCTPGQYQVAALCDRIVMADMGMLDLCSPALNVMHLKDALDLIGIQVEVTRVGEYKGAVEPFMLPAMSEHLREHYKAMLASMNEDVVRRIAAGRGLEPTVVRELQGRRLFGAEEARSLGLADRIVPWSGIERAIAIELGSEVELEAAEPKKKAQDLDLFGLIMKVLRGRRDRDDEVEDHKLVVLHLAGAIEDGDKPNPGSMVSGPSVELIDELAANAGVEGVVVRINSPGGSATASEAIRQALARLAEAKPVVFSMGELAASGGYWITAIGQPIVAEVGTITGSIGVFGLILKPAALMRRMGIRHEIVALDDGPLMEALDRPMPEAAKAKIQEFVDDVYDRFLANVAASRGMTTEEVDAIAGGRVWSGQQAVELGLVDAIGGLDEALKRLRAKAGAGDDVEVEHLPRPKAFADALMESFLSAESRAGLRAGLEVLAARAFRLDQLVPFLRSALDPSEPFGVWAMVPASVRVR